MSWWSLRVPSITEPGCTMWRCHLMHQEQPKHNLSVFPVELWLVKWLQMELDDHWHALREFLPCSVPSKLTLGLSVQSCVQGTKERHSPAKQSRRGCEPACVFHGDAQADNNSSSSCQDLSPRCEGCMVKSGSCSPITAPKPGFPRVPWVGRVCRGRRPGLLSEVRKASSQTTSWQEVDLFISTACLVPPFFILDWVNPPDTSECALVNKHHGLIFLFLLLLLLLSVFLSFQLKLLCFQRARQHNLCRLLSNF